MRCNVKLLILCVLLTGCVHGGQPASDYDRQRLHEALYNQPAAGGYAAPKLPVFCTTLGNGQVICQ